MKVSLSRARLSKYKLKKILKCFCVDVDATRTAHLTGINRNTVNRYYLWFRRLVFFKRTNDLHRITGAAELDESYFGASRLRGNHRKRKRGRGTLKQPVFGIFERDGTVYTEIVPDCSKKTLQSLILGRIAPEAVIHTDGWKGYDGLVDVGYDKHFRVNHSKNEFSNKHGVHVNGIESFWSFTKRRLAKFNGVKVNFELHLKESEWRWKKKSEQLSRELFDIIKLL